MDKLEHEMYLNFHISQKLTFRVKDKLEHEMYLNHNVHNGLQILLEINWNMRCI